MKIVNVVLKTAAFFLLVSCAKDTPAPSGTTVQINGSGHIVYITCEGNYGSNNSSVSLYVPQNNSVVGNYFASKNNNAVLGDVCQSIIQANDNFYLSINNSGKIMVLSVDAFKTKGVISGLTSPRFILPVSFQKAYVSDLYANAISIIDLNSYVKTGSISCPGWTERMALLYNKAFITNMKRKYVYVINTANDQLSDSVLVGLNAGSILCDKNSKIWVLSSGDPSNNVPGKLTRFDGVSLQVELSLNFASGDNPGSLCVNSTHDTLYYLNSAVYQLPIVAAALPTQPFVKNTGNNFYGLAVSDKDYGVYISDAIDYVQSSSVFVYTPNGQLRSSFKAGINASGFYFQ